MTEVKIIIFLRPKISVILPLIKQPKTAPNRTAVVTPPSCESVRAQPLASCKKISVPEITPVSKPNRNPPIAATLEIAIIKSLFCLFSASLFHLQFSFKSVCPLMNCQPLLQKLPGSTTSFIFIVKKETDLQEEV